MARGKIEHAVSWWIGHPSSVSSVLGRVRLDLTGRSRGTPATAALPSVIGGPGVIHWFLRLSGIGNHSYPMLVILPDLLVVEVLFKDHVSPVHLLTITATAGAF
jgi:hypothetical protein